MNSASSCNKKAPSCRDQAFLFVVVITWGYRPYFLVHRTTGPAEGAGEQTEKLWESWASRKPHSLVMSLTCEALWKGLMPISYYKSDLSVVKRHLASLVYQISHQAEIPMAKYILKTHRLIQIGCRGLKIKRHFPVTDKKLVCRWGHLSICPCCSKMTFSWLSWESDAMLDCQHAWKV